MARPSSTAIEWSSLARMKSATWSGVASPALSSAAPLSAASGAAASGTAITAAVSMAAAIHKPPCPRQKGTLSGEPGGSEVMWGLQPCECDPSTSTLPVLRAVLSPLGPNSP